MTGPDQERPPGGADPERSALQAAGRQGVAVAVATSLYGVSFGALAVANGLSILQACLCSLLMFTGGSQFTLVGVLGGGGTATAAVAASTLVGVRNALYGLQLAALLRPGPGRRFVAAQVTIDESTAVAVAQPTPAARARGFWVTGIGVYLGWNLMTFLGALAGNALGDPRRYGLDAAAAAAFLALLWPRLRSADVVAVALAAAVVAGILVPFVPVGIPVVAAAGVAAAAGLLRPPPVTSR